MIALFVVETTGINTSWLPSLSVPSIIVKGKLNPPSTDNFISTLVALIGDTLVSPTFHVIV